jgi:hypothetical protein
MFERLLDLLQDGTISLLALQKPAVAPEHLFQLVAAEFKKRIVGKNDGIVGLRWIGDNHGHAADLHRREKHIFAFLRKGRRIGAVDDRPGFSGQVDLR